MTGRTIWMAALAGAAMLAAPLPAAAQFFLKSYDYSGAAVTGANAGLAQPLPGATDAEGKAALVWTMRAALNVAALQCQFESTLLTQGTYNAILADHAEELKAAWGTLNGYFTRTSKTVKAGQTALDQFGTRTYSSFATVSSQYGFCRTAAAVGRDTLFAARGGLAAIAADRMQELRNSLVPYGEQHFPRYIGRDAATLPRLDVTCWDKKARWRARACGAEMWSRIADARSGTRSGEG